MDFELIMFIALVITGVIWLADIILFKPRRATGARVPLLTEYSESFFPVILLVFLLRSFLFEPFKIPSGSMLPTLLVGDFILVNKYEWGIRLPVINRKIIDIGTPQRGDVMVFRYPKDPSLDYIKRVVGLPGDTVTYRNKRLTINGVPQPVVPDGVFTFTNSSLTSISADRYQEKLGQHTHDILNQAGMPVLFVEEVDSQFPYRQNCSYDSDGFTCNVPAGYYFMMGDNRDNSNDSRYWGFVPDRNVVGKAVLIWMNFDEPKRIGTLIK